MIDFFEFFGSYQIIGLSITSVEDNKFIRLRGVGEEARSAGRPSDWIDGEHTDATIEQMKKELEVRSAI